MENIAQFTACFRVSGVPFFCNHISVVLGANCFTFLNFLFIFRFVDVLIIFFKFGWALRC